MPTEIEILAVEAADTCTIAEGLTPAVEAAVDPLACKIYADLKRRAPAEEPRTPKIPQSPGLLRAFHRLTVSHERDDGPRLASLALV